MQHQAARRQPAGTGHKAVATGRLPSRPISGRALVDQASQEARSAAASKLSGLWTLQNASPGPLQAPEGQPSPSWLNTTRLSIPNRYVSNHRRSHATRLRRFSPGGELDGPASAGTAGATARCTAPALGPLLQPETARPWFAGLRAHHRGAATHHRCCRQRAHRSAVCPMFLPLQWVLDQPIVYS